MTIMQGPPAGRDVFDVCVVGSGPAGLAVALTCGSRGQSVVVLEAGGEGKASSAMDSVSILDQAKHTLLDASTRIRFGGTSSVWGGLCVPYDPIDFEDRPWVPAPAWPITYAEAAKWLSAAGQFLDCGTTFEGSDPPPATARKLDVGQLGRLTRRASLSRVYRKIIAASKSVTLCLKTEAVDVACDEAGTRAVGVDVSVDGSVKRILARRIVLAAGGLRSTRFLLSLARLWPLHFAAGQAPLGKYYMGHLTGEIATIVFRDPLAAASYLYGRDAEGRWAQRRIKLSPSLQAEERLLNTAFTVRAPLMNDHRHRDGALSSVLLLASVPGVARTMRSERLNEAIARIRRGDHLLHLKNVVRHPAATARSIAAYTNQIRIENLPLMALNRSGRYALRYHAEQVPNLDSRVFLSGSRANKLVVDFRYVFDDVHSVVRSHQLLDKALRTEGLGHIEYDCPDDQMYDAVKNQARDGFHQLGTTRMSGDPQTGVVDPDCRVHGFANLYVASASTLPTSGGANPTLFTVALALRLADHISAAL